MLIRAGILLAVALLCYRVFAPFLTLTIWALILAVTLYPLHRAIAGRLKGKQGLSATLLVLLGIALLVVPTAVLMNSFGDTVQDFIARVQTNSVEIPLPPDGVAGWPVVGKKLHDTWSRAHDDLPGLVQSLQPKIGNSPGPALLSSPALPPRCCRFWAPSFSPASSWRSASGARACQAIFQRVAGRERGEEFTSLAAATIRAVAQGVVGVAFIQAILVGLSLLVAGVPLAGALAGIVLVFGIAQVPAVIITLPAIAYIWTRGDHGTVAAILYTVLLLVCGMADNVLKPLMLGRGVDVPMPIILVGALGGMAAAGIIGMFVGATLLALAYQVFTGWVAETQG